MPHHLYEAAEIDGAGAWAKFRNVTWPMITPTTFFVLVVTTINLLLGAFDMVNVMTQGGPLDASNVFVFNIFRTAFTYFQYGLRVGDGVRAVHRRAGIHRHAVAGAEVLGALLMAATTTSQTTPATHSSAPLASSRRSRSTLSLAIGGFFMVFPFILHALHVVQDRRPRRSFTRRSGYRIRSCGRTTPRRSSA